MRSRQGCPASSSSFFLFAFSRRASNLVDRNKNILCHRSMVTVHPILDWKVDDDHAVTNSPNVIFLTSEERRRERGEKKEW